MGLSVDVIPAGPASVRLAVAGDIDLTTVGDLSTAMSAEIGAGRESIIVDLSQVTFLDSTGIGALVTGRQLADAAGAVLRISDARDRIRWVLDLSGVWPYLSGEDTGPQPRGARSHVSEAFTLDDLARVRALVQAAATAASFDDRREDLVLAVNELATNAIRHGGGRGQLTIEYAVGAITIEVRDWGSGLTSPDAGRLPDVTVSGGRGLWITRRLFPQFTMESTSTGLTARLVLSEASTSGAAT